MNAPRFRQLAAMVTLAASALGACGIGTDDSPRNVAPANQQQLGVASDRSAGAATGTARIYLLAPEGAGQSQALQAVARDVTESATEVISELLAGPNAQEIAGQLRTALPAGLQLLSATRRSGVLRIDVSEELGELSGEALVAAVAQLVFTASELDGVQSTKILIGGVDQRLPAGNGELQSLPLTVYDYPGLVMSSQPPYPAIPTTKQPTA